jgi:hypothetical protein
VQTQAGVLEAERGVDQEASARALADGVQALLAWAPLRDGVQDQLDVESHEGADGQR